MPPYLYFMDWRTAARSEGKEGALSSHTIIILSQIIHFVNTFLAVFLWFFGKKCTWIQNPKFIISALGHAVACHKPAYPRTLRGNPADAFALSLRLVCLTPAIEAANLCATPKCMRPSLSFAFAPLFGVKVLQRCNAVTFIANATGANRYKFLPVCFVLQWISHIFVFSYNF